MNADEAWRKLYSLAMFAPGATVPGSSATFANVLLRAEREVERAETALDGTSISDERSLPLELRTLRVNIEQRQTMLREVHDALTRANRGGKRLRPHERCGHSACSQHYIDTGRSECVEPTHRQARGTRIAREERDAVNRSDPSADPGR